MRRAELHQGTYTADRRILEYWTRCENCPERKGCKHTCDHPGWMRFRFDGHDKGILWQGVITLRKIAGTVREYLECEEEALPLDVAVPMRQMRLEGATND